MAPLLLAAVTVLALAGGACSSGDSDSADPTLPTKPGLTTTTSAPAPADPYAIPKVIDEAYVNRVLAALNRVRGDALRSVVSKEAIDIDSVERLRAIYNDPEFDVALQGLRDQHKRGLDMFKSPPGDRISTVTSVVRASSDCVFVLARLDFSQVIRDAEAPQPGEVQAITLHRTQSGADPNQFNKTHWSISFEEVLEEDAGERSRECVPSP
ncbi:MAG TPA: hypothetical protein VM142_15930 [Acidimicrobiales bacterium]|nr:hypothetical protein [Acidimicrobiales bacterium]